MNNEEEKFAGVQTSRAAKADEAQAANEARCEDASKDANGVAGEVAGEDTNKDAGKDVGEVASEDDHASRGEKRSKEPLSVSRRSLFIGVGSTAALLGLGALRYVGHTPVCRPPGGQDEAHLVSACIRCEKCYEICPRQVIVPAHIEDGLLGMRSPMVNFDANYCDFCTEENGGEPLCVKVCPTEALILPENATKENVIIGLAVIDESQCLAFRDTGCKYCYDACPYEAIELSTEGRNPLPSVIADKCNGCGACESVCVSLKAGSIVAGATERAIVVKPLDTLE